MCYLKGTSMHVRIFMYGPIKVCFLFYDKKILFIFTLRL